MIPALAPLFVGDLAPYCDALALMDDPRPARRVGDWLAPASFADVLHTYGAPQTDDAARGLTSEWSKDYLLRLLPPVMAATLLSNHRLPLSLASVDLVLDDGGKPLAFKLPHAGETWPAAEPGGVDDPFRRFAPLIDDHLLPLVAALAAHSRLAPRVFWSNAANYVEWLVGAIASRMPMANVADARAMLTCRHRPDGRENPFFQPVRYRTDGAATVRRQRRVCCVRYLVPDTPLCGNCPLTAVPARGAASDGQFT
jgi:ferric iron reductase protein FhuF